MKEFKQYTNLSRYIIEQDGTVTELSTGEIVPLVSNKTYKLTTDETVPLMERVTTTKLIRRFTKEDIAKMWEHPNATKFVEPIEQKPTPTEMSYPYFLIEGTAYKSSRDAGEALGVSYQTILRKCKANKDGWFYIES